ncbi:unnamed protein product [Symbiodinium sp. CCMP2592]|nr:unnamed protein product [Symbiodinium sp. CCMP2592]
MSGEELAVAWDSAVSGGDPPNGDVSSDLQAWQQSASRVPRAQLKEALESAEAPACPLLGGGRAFDAELRRWQPSLAQADDLGGESEAGVPAPGTVDPWCLRGEEAVQEILVLRHELHAARGEVRRLWAQLAARDGRVARLEAALARSAQCPVCGTRPIDSGG